MGFQVGCVDVRPIVASVFNDAFSVGTSVTRSPLWTRTRQDPLICSTNIDQQTINQGLDQAVIAALKREKRVYNSIGHHQAQIEDNCARLTNYFLEGLLLQNERIVSCHEALQHHRQRLAKWQAQHARILRKKRRAEERAVEREVEIHRQAALKKYGLDRDAESPQGETSVFSEQSAHQTGGLIDGTVPNMPSRLEPIKSEIISGHDHGQDHVFMFEAEALGGSRSKQIKFERSRLAKGKQPINFFNVDCPGGLSPANLTPGNRVLLERIIEQPELLKLNPHAKEYLESISSEPNDPTIRDARAALAAYPEALQRIPRRRISSNEQQVHDAIQDCAKLSDQAKLILLVTTFIPCGHYLTYNAIQEWVRLATKGIVPCSHVVSALRKAESEFELDEVPVHRVIERNGGFWGTHMPSTDDQKRADLLDDEEGLVTCDGRITGSALELFEIAGDMRKTAVEIYVKRFP